MIIYVVVYHVSRRRMYGAIVLYCMSVQSVKKNINFNTTDYVATCTSYTINLTVVWQCSNTPTHDIT